MNTIECKSVPISFTLSANGNFLATVENSLISMYDVASDYMMKETILLETLGLQNQIKFVLAYKSDNWLLESDHLDVYAVDLGGSISSGYSLPSIKKLHLTNYSNALTECSGLYHLEVLTSWVSEAQKFFVPGGV